MAILKRTNTLRWLKVWHGKDTFFTKRTYTYTLQQMYINDKTGEEFWKNIEVVEGDKVDFEK